MYLWNSFTFIICLLVRFSSYVLHGKRKTSWNDSIFINNDSSFNYFNYSVRNNSQQRTASCWNNNTFGVNYGSWFIRNKFTYQYASYGNNLFSNNVCVLVYASNIALLRFPQGRNNQRNILAEEKF